MKWIDELQLQWEMLWPLVMFFSLVLPLFF